MDQIDEFAASLLIVRQAASTLRNRPGDLCRFSGTVRYYLTRKLFKNIKDTFARFFNEALVIEQGIKFPSIKVESPTFFIDT